MVTHLPAIASYHRPILISLGVMNSKPPFYFETLNFWCDHKDFNTIIDAYYKTPCYGYFYNRLVQGLNSLNPYLSQWHRSKFQNLKIKINFIKQQLDFFQSQLMLKPIHPLFHLEKQLHYQLLQKYIMYKTLTLIQKKLSKISKKNTSKKNTLYCKS